MPGLLLDAMDLDVSPVPKAPEIPSLGFIVSHQKVSLEVDFSTQTVTGRTEITILPQQEQLSTIRLNARQCTIAAGGIQVNGSHAQFKYNDPSKLLGIPEHYNWTTEQHELQKERIKPLVDDESRNTVALEIEIPHDIVIASADPFADNAANALTERAIGASAARNPSLAINKVGEPVSAMSTMTPKTAAEQSAKFQPLIVRIEFSVSNFRDGLYFVGVGAGDARFPHVYTRHSIEPGTACCIFPCVDDPAMRCTWELEIKCARTLGDAFKKSPKPATHPKKHQSHASSIGAVESLDSDAFGLSDEEKLLEMAVVCSGEMMHEEVDAIDSSKKILKFEVSAIVAPQHIGFSIGPFEQVDLSEFREEADEEKLGQGQSMRVSAYCLPKRAEEVRHTCAPLAPAMDWFSLNFSGFPFAEYKMVFVNDQARDVEHTAGLSLCDARLLFPSDIIDPEVETVRTLVHALASQWMGVMVVPDLRSDRWITIGLSHYMTGLFMKHLCGNNEYMFRQKLLSDKLVELDINRPSIHALGEVMHLGSFENDFMALKAPLVLFILNNRIIKSAGTLGLVRVITKIAMGANTGAASESIVSTEPFRRQVEKFTKYNYTGPFWNQWVLGAGCPRFYITQKFNKKRVIIEMKIAQKQDTMPTQRPLEKPEFLRELKEEVSGVFAGELQPLFTGSMTIRIHEADGTPYEHVVELREGQGTIEIPYATKYKRLKRNRLQKERAATSQNDYETGEDKRIFALGDVLQSPQEVREWGLADWTEEQQKEMENDSYEWYRMDADHEWICSKEFHKVESWMYISQLQQDRDVVAQQESMLYLKAQPPHPLVATFCARTIMDPKYYYGIRKMALECLAVHADPSINWIGWKHLEKAFSELFCYPGTQTPRPNDFSGNKKEGYFVEMSIPRAVARIRERGSCPKFARQFILDQLRFNDNGNNEFSDNYKVSNLLIALTESVLPIALKQDSEGDIVMTAADDDEDDPEPGQFRDTVVEELDRYRRSDELTHSFHNLYTTTVLECKKKLMKAGVIPLYPTEFAQYLHDRNSENVRIKAWETLADLGFLGDEIIAPFLLNVLSTDPSPHMRTQLFKIFVSGLASIALGEKGPGEEAGNERDADGDDMVIIDAEVQAAARKAHIVRTTSIDGALLALKVEMAKNFSIKNAIWNAIRSPVITVTEQLDLLDVCLVLYDAEESLILKLRYPRFWQVQKVGKTKLLFKQTKRIRTKSTRRNRPQPQALPPAPAPDPAPAPAAAAAPAPSQRLVLKPVMKQPVVKQEPVEFVSFPAISKISTIKINTSATSMGPPKNILKRPQAPERSQSSASSDGQPPRKKRIVKFKIKDMEKIWKILRSSPNPAKPKKKVSSARDSPAPRASPASSITAQSPSATTLSASPAPPPRAPPSDGMAVKPRKPLPDLPTRTPLPDVRKALPDAPTPPVRKSNIIKLKVPGLKLKMTKEMTP